MNTPILDFVRNYAASNAVRMHMPGHKGKGTPEALLDITEIAGADDLFHANGIIGESEKNASQIFGCDTYYSTEGSSLCIRAMLYLCRANSDGKKPWVLAARNIHKTFVSACVLLDLDVEWIASENDSFISLDITASDVAKALSDATKKRGNLPCCVYLTSPDYLGHILPVSDIAKVCHENGIPLVVDNAHGAYLKFLEPSLHPIDLGADMCCDSAHKTLPALTGSAYLHVNSDILSAKKDDVKTAMALFASTSPSWLILQSLDRLNPILETTFKTDLKKTIDLVSDAKKVLSDSGISLLGEEPLKITIKTKEMGCEGEKFAQSLRENRTPVEVEFSDPDQVVLMVSSNNTKEEIEAVVTAVLNIAKKEPAETNVSSTNRPPRATIPERKMSMREAAMSPWETVSLNEAEGRIAHLVDCSCPPAIPVVVCGEKIGRNEIAILRYYGYDSCRVVR
ncbi:MAG: hypothetical protein IK109_10155 [Clostridiales bacterium]|nr:hypothetical protein [Clostridiales bacterium]